MRKGKNSSKEAVIKGSRVNHRVLIPLYIPFEEAYYLEAFSIFEMCLNSLHNVSIYELNITVISDGCCDAVNDKLYKLYQNNKINELIIENDNIGKLNAVLRGLRSVNEEFVTITDADILFLENWDKSVFQIFQTFKKAAVVSPIPVFRKQLSYTGNIWLDSLFSKKMRFKPVKNPEALERFAKSLGWQYVEDKYKDVIMTLEENNVTAVVSAAHCVATYKASYLKEIPKENTIYKLGGNTEGKYLDNPPYKKDGYRLSTYNNFAYHMGNTKESWLVAIFNAQKFIKDKIVLPKIEGSEPKNKPIKSIFIKLFLKSLKIESIYDYFLLKKGLDKEKLKGFRD